MGSSEVRRMIMLMTSKQTHDLSCCQRLSRLKNLPRETCRQRGKLVPEAAEEAGAESNGTHNIKRMHILSPRATPLAELPKPTAMHESALNTHTHTHTQARAHAHTNAHPRTDDVRETIKPTTKKPSVDDAQQARRSKGSGNHRALVSKHLTTL